jgi:hypothetical protein
MLMEFFQVKAHQITQKSVQAQEPQHILQRGQLLLPEHCQLKGQ